MLRIMAGAKSGFDSSTNKFVMIGGVPIDLEHSLVSLSKWEQDFEKPFLSATEKTSEEVIAYVRAMTLTEGVSEKVFGELSKQNLEDIHEYIDRQMTATVFHDAPGQPRSREVITAETIYYWMSTYNIPFSCETWHLNRLLTLIRFHNVKQAKPKKMSRADRVRQMEQMNRERQEKFNTRG